MSKETTTYKLLAVGFWQPDEKLVAALRATPLFRDVLSNVSLDELQHEYNAIFSLSVAGGLPPYETEYGIKDIFMKTQRMADIGGFYRAFGMEVAETARDRIDFIGAELEFMHWVTLKEQHAEKTQRQAQAALCRDAAAKFLQDHLGRWAPFLGERMAETSRHPFYQKLGQELAAFIRSECRRLGIQPEEITAWQPAPPAEEFTCDFNACGADQDHTVACPPSFSTSLPVVK